MKVPEQVKNEARELIEQYGDSFKYIGKYEGQDTFMFNFPEDSDTGFPFVYLFNGVEAIGITNFLALDIINSLIKD